MQVNMLEAKTQLSKLVDAVLRGEEVVIANRGKPVVKLVKAEAPPVRRLAGAWEGLMSEEQIDHAFSPEVEAEFAREWLDSIERPLHAGLKPRAHEPSALAGTRKEEQTPRPRAAKRRAR